jgi:hypothetical protein
MEGAHASDAWQVGQLPLSAAFLHLYTHFIATQFRFLAKTAMRTETMSICVASQRR